MTFKINSLKKPVPFVNKAVLEIKIQKIWFSEHTDESIYTVQKVLGFNIVAVTSDNHSTIPYAFNMLLKMYPIP